MNNKPTYLNPTHEHSTDSLLKEIISNLKKHYKSNISNKHSEIVLSPETYISQRTFFNIELPFYYLHNKEQKKELFITSDYCIYDTKKDLINTTIGKQKNKKKFYENSGLLLGRDTKEPYFLRLPTFNCSCFWGFGYVENFECHLHINSSFTGKQDYYDYETNTWQQTEYIHNLYDSPKLKETTFSKEEGWELSELFAQFYLLKQMADFSNNQNPGCNISSTTIKHGSQKTFYKKLITIMIPKVILRILEILSPSKKTYLIIKTLFAYHLNKAKQIGDN